VTALTFHVPLCVAETGLVIDVTAVTVPTFHVPLCVAATVPEAVTVHVPCWATGRPLDDETTVAESSAPWASLTS
jgi:hypothetical protein